jgi:hypothetical protein
MYKPWSITVTMRQFSSDSWIKFERQQVIYKDNILSFIIPTKGTFTVPLITLDISIPMRKTISEY